MNFDMYMESKIPGYKELVPEEVLNSLKSAWDKKEGYRKVRENATNMALNKNNAGIDFSTDVDKALADENRWTSMLEESISDVRKSLGLVSEEKEEVSSYK